MSDMKSTKLTNRNNRNEIRDLPDDEQKSVHILDEDEADHVAGGKPPVDTTMALGEECGPCDPPIITTMALGEEGGFCDIGNY
jgi:hypothetical protein